jgi:hypothetical protein
LHRFKRQACYNGQMKKARCLYDEFVPELYQLSIEPIAEKNNFFGKVIISGRKKGRPSHRITLHQKKLRILAAKITRKDKIRDAEIHISRINHLNSFEEVRLHTIEMLYPGMYEIELHYEQIGQDTGKSIASRGAMPSVDEAEAWAGTVIKQ